MIYILVWVFPLYFFVDLSGLNFLNFGICIRLWWQALILKSLKFSAAAAFGKWLDRLDKFFFDFYGIFKLFLLFPEKFVIYYPLGFKALNPPWLPPKVLMPITKNSDKSTKFQD